jgi:pimeloyl-ACP methyl ester carboxylesterase
MVEVRGIARKAGDGSPIEATGNRRPGAGRRWARRVAIGVGGLFLAGTLASFAYNAATDRRENPPPGLRYVQTGGIQTRYLQWGTVGTPVVLVHGAFESADTWEPTGRLLASGHRVYALDLAGFGYTGRDGHYTRDDQARQLLAFLAALGLDRPVLVGHSSGAAIVAEATLRAPDRVGGLMLLDGDALATGAGARSPTRHLVIDPYRTTLLRLALRSDALVRSVYQQQCGPACPRLDAAGVDAWRRPFQVAGAESSVWTMLDQGVPGLDPDRLGQLTRLSLPKTVVFGAEDQVFDAGTPAQTASRIGAPPPTVVPGAHHLIMVGVPGAVAEAVNALAHRVG